MLSSYHFFDSDLLGLIQIFNNFLGLNKLLTRNRYDFICIKIVRFTFNVLHCLYFCRLDIDELKLFLYLDNRLTWHLHRFFIINNERFLHFNYFHLFFDSLNYVLNFKHIILNDHFWLLIKYWNLFNNRHLAIHNQRLLSNHLDWDSLNNFMDQRNSNFNFSLSIYFLDDFNNFFSDNLYFDWFFNDSMKLNSIPLYLNNFCLFLDFQNFSNNFNCFLLIHLLDHRNFPFYFYNL